MRKFRTKVLALIIAVIMLLGCLPLNAFAVGEADDTVYRAKWAQSKLNSSFAYIYPSVNGTGSIVNPKLYAQSFMVTVAADGWYYVTSEEWGELDTHRYVKADTIEILPPLSAQIGTFDVTVDGLTIPADAVLKMSEISPENYDPEFYNYFNPIKMGDLLGAYDISIMQGENEWQPFEGNEVEVSFNAASWGLYTGCLVYAIHIHKNADGTKDVEVIGPVKVKNGRVDITTDRFSDYYLLKGVSSQSLTNNDTDHFYVEQGTTLQFGSTVTNWNPKEVVPAGITANNNSNSIIIGADVPVGTEIEFRPQWQVRQGWQTVTRQQTIIVHVMSRGDIVKTFIPNNNLGIYIMQPQENPTNGLYPSEPGNTSGTYYGVALGNGEQTYTIGNGSTKLTNNASGYLNPDIGNSPAWAYDPDGDPIYGIVDPTGEYSLDAFVINGQQTINWKNVALAIANYNNTQNTSGDIKVRFFQENKNGGTNTVRTVILVDNPAKTLDAARDNQGNVKDNSEIHYEEFELIPYVIKYMSDGWHVDVAVIHEESYLLGYDLNLGEGFTTSTGITLPGAQIIMDNSQNEKGVNVQVGQISGLQTIDGEPGCIRVKNRNGESGVFRFKGWYTSNTASSSDTLIDPNSTTRITADTIMYAIWEYVAGDFVVDIGTLSISKMVTLAQGSPFGAKIPTVTDSGYFEFEFNIAFALNEDHLKNISFEANKTDSNTGSSVSVAGTLAGVLEGSENYTFLSFTQAGGVTTFTIKLGNGEAIHFLGVPIDAPEEAGTDPDIYTVSEIIPTEATRYSAAGATTLSATMSVTTEAQCRFQNYYTPPVTGLEIIASGGDDGEVFVYVLTSTSIQGFKPINVAVPAGGSTIVTGLLAGNYRVTEITDWNYLWSADASNKTVTLTNSGNGAVEFKHTSNGNRWMFGHSYEKKNVS